MRKKIKNILLLGVLLFILTACGKEPLGNNYVEGSDYQYMLNSNDHFFQIRARGEQGYFFLRGHYIYYFDDATQQLTPLCNKVDCLHSMETDENEYAKCNAYIQGYTGTSDCGISYCNGYLYFTDIQFTSEGDFIRLYRIKEDGSQREMVCEWDFWKDSVEQWCIHRDTFYFVNQQYVVEKDENGKWESIEKYYVKKIPLTGESTCKEEIIYEADDNMNVFSLAYLEAYGNYLYFEELGTKVKDITTITDENYLESMYHYRMAYNIETKELIEIKIPQENKYCQIQNIAFWKDKLVLVASNPEKELGENRNIYIANLDGSNSEILFEDVKMGESCFSDGTYLYLSNARLVSHGIEDTQYYKVYDKELNLVDTFQLPFEGGSNVEIGYADKMYFFLPKEDGTGADMHCFDKSTVGTYNGEPFATTIVAEYLYSKPDIEEIEELE